MLKNPTKEDEDHIEELLNNLYKLFSEKIKKQKENNKDIDKPDIIPITLFYVAKSQKEAFELAKRLNCLTKGLIFLTGVLIFLTIILIIKEFL